MWKERGDDMEEKHSAISIANWLLAYNKSIADSGYADLLTNLKLQKLLYYVQGASLALLDKPMFEDEIEAWQYGPVVPSVYSKFACFKKNVIELNNEPLPNLSENEITLIKEIYDQFGQYSAFALVKMTHEETPWIEAYYKKDVNKVIPKESIKKYFNENYVC